MVIISTTKLLTDYRGLWERHTKPVYYCDVLSLVHPAVVRMHIRNSSGQDVGYWFRSEEGCGPSTSFAMDSV